MSETGNCWRKVIITSCLYDITSHSLRNFPPACHALPEVCEDGEGKFVLVHGVKVLSSEHCRAGRGAHTNQNVCACNCCVELCHSRC